MTRKWQVSRVAVLVGLCVLFAAAPANGQGWQVSVNSLQCALNGKNSGCSITKSGFLYSDVFSAQMACTKLTCPPQRANPVAHVATIVGVSAPCPNLVGSNYTGSIQTTGGLYFYVWAVLRQSMAGTPWTATASDAVDCDGVEGYIGPGPGAPPFNCGIQYI
jgi:hypothetical protein